MVKWWNGEMVNYSRFLQNVSAIAMHVDEDDSLKQGLIDSKGRVQQAIFINEFDLVFRNICHMEQRLKFEWQKRNPVDEHRFDL